MKRSKLSTALALATAMGGLVGGAYAPSASAVNIAAQNVGDVLIFPYYTARCHTNDLGIVEDCWQTLINITNTTNATLAVKLKFVEGYNSREVLDFTIVMSPHDVFAGYVDKGAGYPKQTTPARFVLAHDEKTCTVPKVETSGQPYLPFSNFGYSGVNTDHAASTVLDSNDRTYEGYIIAIVEGHSYENDGLGKSWDPQPVIGGWKDSILLPPNLITGLKTPDWAPWVAYYAKHVPVGGPTDPTAAPRDCSKVREAFTKAPFTQLVGATPTTLPRIVWTANEFGEPVNALKGNYNFLNVNRGVAAGGSAVALANFVRIGADDNVPQKGLGSTPVVGGIAALGGCTAANMFFNPLVNVRSMGWEPQPGGTTWCPNLITAQGTESGFDALEPSFADAYDSAGLNAHSLAINDPVSDVVEGDFPNRFGHLAVAEVLRAGSLINEWSFNPALGVSTEWVVTHPTKDFFVDSVKYVGAMSAVNPRRFPIPMPPMPTPPFAEEFSTVTNGNSCNEIGLTAWNREEQGVVIKSGGNLQSPLPRSSVQSLCFETNVIQFSANRTILDSKLTLDLTAAFLPFAAHPTGWLNIDLTASPAASASEDLLGAGLPAVGFMIKQRALQGEYFKNFGYLVDHSRRVPYTPPNPKID